MNWLSVNKNLSIPRYKQIITSVEHAIKNGKLKKGDQLPSINKIRDDFSLSRDTVILAFNELKTRGIIQSIAGKGYYVNSHNISVKQKIFLLFDELNSFKESLYNSFNEHLDSNIEVDIFFHHFNSEVFNQLIYNNIGNYNFYIIMPANIEDSHIAIQKLQQDTVIILDQIVPSLSNYTSIYQNFKTDIYLALEEVKTPLRKYTQLFFVHSDHKQPKEMLAGYALFCSDFGFEYTVIDNIEDHALTVGSVYIIPDDRDLIQVVKKLKKTSFVLSKDIGIISYNETPLKEIIKDGITTISTDFNFMGERLAQMIVNNEKTSIENPSKIIIRNSL